MNVRMNDGVAEGPEFISLHPGLYELSARELDLLACVDIALPSNVPGTINISQNLGRTRAVSGGSACITPRTRALLTHRLRLANGVECLNLQGIHFSGRESRLHSYDSGVLTDLAGNAFNTYCAAAMHLVGEGLLALCWSAACESAAAPRHVKRHRSNDWDSEDELWG